MWVLKRRQGLPTPLIGFVSLWRNDIVDERHLFDVPIIIVWSFGFNGSDRKPFVLAGHKTQPLYYLESLCGGLDKANGIWQRKVHLHMRQKTKNCQEKCEYILVGKYILVIILGGTLTTKFKSWSCFRFPIREVNLFIWHTTGHKINEEMEAWIICTLLIRNIMGVFWLPQGGSAKNGTGLIKINGLCFSTNFFLEIYRAWQRFGENLVCTQLIRCTFFPVLRLQFSWCHMSVLKMSYYVVATS